MPTSELTGLGDKFNSQRLQIELSVFETVQSIMCVRTTMRILLTLDLFTAVGMACVDLRFESPISSKVNIYHNYPWLGVRSVPYDSDIDNYSDPEALPALNLKSRFRLRCRG
jgi:hypothetical protein